MKNTISNLTNIQKAYIWLAGSYPKLILVQGQGKRSKHLKYGIDEAAQELVVFGYSHPCYFMENRGIFRKGQAFSTWILTDDGERLFLELQVKNQGTAINARLEKVYVKPRRVGEA